MRCSLETMALKLRELILSSSLIGVAAHRNADPDALASMLGMLDLATRIGGRAYCILPEGLSQASKRMVERLVLEAECASSIAEDTDLLVILDTASEDQLGEISGALADRPYVVVDHHSQNTLLGNAALAIHVPEASSTSEIMALLYSSLGLEPSPNICAALMAGIIYDSRRFMLVGPATFKAALLLHGCSDYSAALEALRSPGPEYPERVARLKAVSRLRVYRLNRHLVAVTHVSAYEASVARSLLDLGADIAIVVSENKGALRVVGRAREEALRRLGISLGRDLMSLLAPRIGGTGGGHDAAAAATGKGSLEETLRILKEVLEEIARLRGLTLSILD